jgi:hypothetical protein
MTQIFKAWVYKNPEHLGGFTGEIDGIEIQTNIEELKGTLVEFYANTRTDLLSNMIGFLKSQGKSGVLRIAK